MKHSQTHTSAEMDLWGRNLVMQLDLASQDLDHNIGERLRIARQRALQARPVPKQELRHNLAVYANGTLSGPPDEGLNPWRILVSALPLLALILGLVFIQNLQQDMAESNIASLDSALLLDDLPPDAYTDPGFVQYLKLQISQTQRHD